MSENPKESSPDLARLRIPRREELAPVARRNRALVWLAGVLAFLLSIGAAGSYSGQITGGAVFRLVDFNSLEMEADVTESSIGKVRVGQRAEIVTDAYPDRVYRGRLRQIVPIADRQKAVVQVRMEILDKDEKLLPEMSAQVAFLSDAIDSAASGIEKRSGRKVWVPEAAIWIVEQETAVYLVEDQKVKVRKIRGGEKMGGMTEVREGLSGGERVIVGGHAGLQEGDEVAVAASK